MNKNLIKSIIIAIFIAFSFVSCTKESTNSYNKKIEFVLRFKDQNNNFDRVIGYSNLEIRKIYSNLDEQQYICKIQIENNDGKYLTLRTTASIDEIYERANNLIDIFVNYYCVSAYDVDNQKYLIFKHPGYNNIDLETNIITNQSIKFNDISVFKHYIQKIVEELK